MGVISEPAPQPQPRGTEVTASSNLVPVIQLPCPRYSRLPEPVCTKIHAFKVLFITPRVKSTTEQAAEQGQS